MSFNPDLRGRKHCEQVYRKLRSNAYYVTENKSSGRRIKLGKVVLFLQDPWNLADYSTDLESFTPRYIFACSNTYPETFEGGKNRTGDIICRELAPAFLPDRLATSFRSSSFYDFSARFNASVHACQRESLPGFSAIQNNSRIRAGPPQLATFSRFEPTSVLPRLLPLRLDLPSFDTDSKTVLGSMQHRLFPSPSFEHNTAYFAIHKANYAYEFALLQQRLRIIGEISQHYRIW